MGILGWLFRDALRENTFYELLEQKKHWYFLALGLFLNFSAVFLTFIRWQILVRALDIPIRTWDAIRISMVGFLFNLSPLGITGGDVLRTYMLARDLKASGSKSLACVFIDRIIGLYVMFFMALVMLFVSGFWWNTDRISSIASMTVVIAFVSASILIAVIMVPDVSGGKILLRLEKIPKIGPMIKKCVTAVSLYQKQKKVLAISALMTFGVHSLFCLAIYFTARGLFETAPSMLSHFLIHPVANITSIIPLPAGPYDKVLDLLYPLFPGIDGTPIKPGYGFIVALGYRIETLLIASLGFVFYLPQRKTIREISG